MGTSVLLSFASLYAVSAPGGYFIPQVGLTIAWPILLLATLIAYVLGAIVRRRLRPNTLQLVPVAALVLTVGLIALDVPMLTRFALSRSAMDRLMVEARRDPMSFNEPGRVGLWKIEGVESYEGGVRFLVSDTGFLDQGGFAYSKHGPPAPKLGSQDSYDHLYGDWYVWVRRF